MSSSDGVSVMAFFNLNFAVTGVKAVDVTLAVISCVVAVLAGTLAFTEGRFWLQSRGNAGRYEGREPLTLPYAVPWLGGFYRMINPHGMYAWALSKSPKQGPVSLRLAGNTIYLLFGETSLKAIFKGSRALTKDNWTLMLFRNGGVPAHDMERFARDKSGTGTIPLVNTPEEDRIWKVTHQVGVEHLANGSAVNIITNNFIKYFTLELDKEPIGQSKVTPIFGFFKQAMFMASTISLIGPNILELDPEFKTTYWDYDDTFLLNSIGLPEFIYPKGKRALRKMLKTSEKWIKAGWENVEDTGKEPDWDPHFGSKFIRETVMTLASRGISQEGQAASMLTMIWAVNSNAIPCAVWVIMEALQHPHLMPILRAEILKVSSGNDVDIARLITECPLLSSIYQECLRARSSNTITRTLIDDLEVDGYVLKKGKHIMSPGWTPFHGPLWDVPGHPANEFWPERFIEMPKMGNKAYGEKEKSQYDVAMRQGNYFPYGGGTTMCTGRFFAKQEIMASAALMILRFDFEVLGYVKHNGKTCDGPAKPDETYAGSGILPPDRDMKVRMTRIK